MREQAVNKNNWRSKIFKIIYHADTPAGKWFDIILIVFIILSVLTIILDSVDELHIKYGDYFYIAEWFFTIIFSLEYILRLISIRS
ncbi:Potassium voltage-gated channel subfamily KQT; possible potassium channel, VIC family, partial [hydrothermal vent metagenome]